MPFITFIYKLGNYEKKFYGKCVFHYISDDHEGLDIEILPYLVNGLNKYRKLKGKSEINSDKVNIAVLSYSDDKFVPTYSSNKEVTLFDFYNIKYRNKNTTYVNGKLIE